MNLNEKLFLRSLGYDLNKKGALFFFDLLRDVREMLSKEMSQEEIKEELPKYYIDYSHFDYEVGLKNYYRDLEEFCFSRKVTKDNKKINNQVMGEVNNMNVENKLIFFATYFNKKEKNNSDENVAVARR